MAVDADDTAGAFTFPTSLVECNSILNDEKAYNPLRLCMAGWRLSDDEFAKFALSLKNAKKLTHLMFLNTHLSNRHLAQLLDALCLLPCFRYLDLSACKIDNAGVKIIADLLANMDNPEPEAKSTLSKQKTSPKTEPSSEASPNKADAKKDLPPKTFPTLSVLILAKNLITEEGCGYLGKALETNISLVKLGLGGNPIPSNIGMVMAEALLMNRTMLKMDFGKIHSIRVARRLNDNGSTRQMMFNQFLKRQDQQLTRFLTNKINVIGERGCGKSGFIHALVNNEPRDVDGLEKEKASEEEFPKISITRVRTHDHLKFWEQLDDPPFTRRMDYVTEHALRLTRDLLHSLSVASKTVLAEKEQNTEYLDKKLENSIYAKKSSTTTAPHPIQAQAQTREPSIDSDAATVSRIDDSLNANGKTLKTRAKGTARLTEFETDPTVTTELIGKKAKARSLKKGPDHDQVKKSSTFSRSDYDGDENDNDTEAEVSKGGELDLDNLENENDGSGSTDEPSLKQEEIMKSAEGQFVERMVAGKGKVSTNSTATDETDVKTKYSGEKSDLKDGPEDIDFEDLEKYVSDQLEWLEGTEYTENEQMMAFENGVAFYPLYDILSADFAAEQKNKKMLEGNVSEKKDYQQDTDFGLYSAFKLNKGKEELLRTLALNEHISATTGIIKDRAKVLSTRNNDKDVEKPLKKKTDYGKASSKLSLLNEKSAEGSIPKVNKPKRRKTTRGLSPEKKGSEYPAIHPAPSLRSNKKSGKQGELLLDKKTSQSSKRRRHVKDHGPCYRAYSENQLGQVMMGDNGLNLNIWEFSDNFHSDSLYTGLYHKLMNSDGYGLTIICFDLSKFVSDSKRAKKNLMHYLQIVKNFPKSRYILVGLKLDKVEAIDIRRINSDVRSCLKEIAAKGLIYKSDEDLYYFPVDSKKIYNLEVVRSKVESASKKSAQVKKYVRLRELCLLDLILCEKYHVTRNPPGTKYPTKNTPINTVTMNEVEFWAKRLGIEPKELTKCLKLFHECGLIIYFPGSPALSNVIFTNVTWFTESLSQMLNANILTKGLEIMNTVIDPDFVERMKPGKALKKLQFPPLDCNNLEHLCLLNMRLLKQILNDSLENEVEDLVAFLKDCRVLADWDASYDIPDFSVFKQDRPKKVRDSIRSGDKLFVGSFLNSKKVVFTHEEALKVNARKNVGLDLPIFVDFDYQMQVKAPKDRVFPAAFNASYHCALIGWVNELRLCLNTPKNDVENWKNPGIDVNVYMHQEASSGLVITQVDVDKLLGFYFKPELKGYSVYLPERYKNSFYIVFMLLKHLNDAINGQLLKSAFRFLVRLGKRKDLKNKKSDPDLIDLMQLMQANEGSMRKVFEKITKGKVHKLGSSSASEVAEKLIELKNAADSRPT